MGPPIGTVWHPACITISCRRESAAAFIREMWMRLALSLALIGTVLASAPLAAQGRGRAADSVPEGFKPPAGMCRIWLPNVPPGKQAAPTDCATAVANRPANARVIFGDPAPARGKAGHGPVPAPLPLAPPPKGKPRPKPPVVPPPNGAGY